MKRLFLVSIVLVAGAIALFFFSTRTDDSPGTAPLIVGAPASADILARGEYLTRAADCAACHTVSGSQQPFAGGVAFKLPMGVIYSSNITADPVSGIGGWSDDDFVRAVREGVRKDGQHLYPAFPYTSYTQLDRRDVLAIKAYLMSLPAIMQGNRRNVLAFPFDQRWAMSFWNAAFFKSRRFAADPTRSAEWNGGAYLATALGHCGECHSPRNLGFGVEHGRELAGYELQGWRAYNITPDPTYGIGAWTAGEIAQYLKTGHAEGRASAAGPMGEAVAHSLQHLDPADILALVDYLRTVPAHTGNHPIDAEPHPVPAIASSADTAVGDVAKGHPEGAQLFAGACASCHQWNGAGQQTPYASIIGTRGVSDESAANVTQVILQGVSLRIGASDVFMPAFSAAYSNSEVAALSNYVVAQFGGKTGTVTAEDVAMRRAL